MGMPKTSGQEAFAKNVSCLEAPCQFDSFITHNTRQYTSEVPIYQRLVSTCPLVTDPENADLFLVPFYFGYMMTLGWGVHAKSAPGERRDTLRSDHRKMMGSAIAVRHALPYLNNQTAARHVFLFTCDSQFVNIDLHPLLRHSLVVHLGDDEFAGDPRVRGSKLKRLHLPNGLIVPYRVSHWMPFGFSPLTAAGPRRVLLSMNVNIERHLIRKQIVSHVRAAAARMDIPGDRLVLASSMMSPPEAVELVRSSTFCLCPTGDSKGFTARFYFTLLHGCLPVRVDGWARNTTATPATYPFAQLINWDRIVIDVPPDRLDTLLPRLARMPASELEDRQNYLRHVAHWLLFDHDQHAHHDASAAVIHTIQQRLGIDGESAVGMLESRRPAHRHGMAEVVSHLT